MSTPPVRSSVVHAQGRPITTEKHRKQSASTNNTTVINITNITNNTNNVVNDVTNVFNIPNNTKLVRDQHNSISTTM